MHEIAVVLEHTCCNTLNVPAVLCNVWSLDVGEEPGKYQWAKSYTSTWFCRASETIFRTWRIFVRLNGVFGFFFLLKCIMHRIASFAQTKNWKSAKHVKIIEFQHPNLFEKEEMWEKLRVNEKGNTIHLNDFTIFPVLIYQLHANGEYKSCEVKSCANIMFIIILSKVFEMIMTYRIHC